MATLHTDSTNATDTSEHWTQQQQKRPQHMHSIIAHDDRLRQIQTEVDLATCSNGLSVADDYGVKSMDDLLPCSKPGEINMSPPAVPSPLATDNIPHYTTATSSTSTLTQVPFSLFEQKQQQQQQSQSQANRTAKDDGERSISSNSNTSDRTGDQDDTSGYDDSCFDDEDTFSCLTGDVSQPCFYGHANDSTATCQSGMSDSNIDLVVPKVNIRSGKQPSNVMMTSYQKPLGQSIGYLSIMVCGDSGIGKTTFIRAFTLMHEIIGGKLFDDDDSTRFGDVENTVMDIPTERTGSAATIKEYYASTMLSTQWNQSQKQVEALDKNICFVDTPGYGAFVDAKAVIRSTTKYLERQFQLTNDILSPTQPSTPKLARLLHNIHGGHSHVDVCLYLILDRIKPVDIEYLRSIQQLCNIIPVIVKADLLSCDQEKALKRKVLQELHDNKIEFYHCGYSFEQLLALCQKEETHDAAPPFCISTKPLNNKHYHKTHMAKGYLKLIQLKDALFYKHVDFLRQFTVAKFIQWRREQTNIMQAYRSQYRHSTSCYATILPTSPLSSSSSTSSSSYTNKQRQNTTSSLTMNDQHQLTTMVDLESMTQKLATREIAERIQDLASKQRRSINLHMANYINDQRQQLEQQKQERLIQLQQKYYVMTQQEKVKFLTSQLNGVLTDFGLLKPGELNSGGKQQQQQQQQKETTATAGLSSSMSSSVWHIYPPPSVIGHGLGILQSANLYLVGATALVVIFISGLLKWWWWSF